MKKLTVFELSIIGFFVGIVVAAYLTYTVTIYGTTGSILGVISLYSIFASLHLPDSYTLVAAFGFFTFVYAVYGLIIGLLLQNMNKFAVLAPLVIFAGFVGVEQYGLVPQQSTVVDSSAAIVRSFVPKPVPQEPRQYFGNEAIGDLNGDGIDDVAFLIPRIEDASSTVYYLTSAIATTTGKIGTNILFLGSEVDAHDISIASSTIYIPLTQKKTSKIIKTYTAQVINGVLTKVVGDM